MERFEPGARAGGGFLLEISSGWSIEGHPDVVCWAWSVMPCSPRGQGDRGARSRVPPLSATKRLECLPLLEYGLTYPGRAREMRASSSVASLEAVRVWRLRVAVWRQR